MALRDNATQGLRQAAGRGPIVLSTGKEDDNKNKFGPDLLYTLAGQIQETAVGFPAGVFQIGKTIGGDLKNAVAGSGGDFKSDDMFSDLVTTTWRDTKRRWSPLFKGDMNKFWDQVETDPLGIALDLATLATGGGAAAGKAGKAAARVGTPGAMTRMAGLKRSDNTFANLVSTARGNGVRADVAPSVAKQQFEQRGGVVGNDGSLWDGPTGFIKSGDRELEIPLSSNLFIRGRQQAVIKTGNTFTRMPIFGANSRGSRIDAKKIDSQHQRQLAVVTANAEQSLRSLDEADQRALQLANWRAQGLDRDKLNKHYGERLDVAAQAAARIEAKAAADGGRPLTSAETHDLAKVATIQSRLDAVNSPDWDAASPEAWTPGVARAMEDLSALSKFNTRVLWELGGEATQKIDFEDFFEMQRSREARHVTDAELDEMDGADADEVNAFKLAQAQGLKMHPHAYVRPHMAGSEILGSQRIGAAANTNSGVASPSTNRSKRNNFVLFDDALDALDPRTVIDAAKQVTAFKSGVAKYEAVLASAREIDTLDDIPAGWVQVKFDKKLDDVDALIDWVDEDAKITFGENQDLAVLGDTMRELRERAASGRMAAPEYLVKEMTADIRSANKFINAYDKVTSNWRTLTLTARPVWITGNVFGQYTLLAATHGPIKAASALMMAMRQKGQGIDLLSEHAPDTIQAGWASSQLDELRRLRNKKSGGDSVAAVAIQQAGGALATVGEKILNINAIISDDYPRRAAFLAEIKPSVKRIQAETGMSFEDAAREFLKDPDVVETLAEKVLSDLVDFRSLSRIERTALRRIAPFYSWIKGSTARTWRLAADEPYKAQMAAYISGYGIEQLEEEFGPLPDFLNGMLPFGEDEEGNQRIITTNSLNPFGTAGDIAGMAKSVFLGDAQVGGTNPAATLNPFAKAVLESVTNRDLFYGTPLDQNGESRGYGERFLTQSIKSFPQVREVLKGTAEERPNAMYEKSLLDQLISYGLIPTKQLDVEQANQRARAQDSGDIGTTI